MELKRLDFIGSSLDDLKEFPVEVRQDVGHALHKVQMGIKPDEAKPLRGFGGAGVLDLIKQKLKLAEELYKFYHK